MSSEYACDNIKQKLGEIPLASQKVKPVISSFFDFHLEIIILP